MASHPRSLVVRAAFFVLAATLAGCAEAPDQRLWVEAKINGHPAHLFVDTGSSTAMVLHDRAPALGLKINYNPNGPGLTDPATLEFWNSTITTRFAVDQVPSYVALDMDGVIGWAQLRGKIVRLDATARSLTPLDHLPNEVAGWTKLRVRPNPRIMTLEVPASFGDLGGLIYVDTGNPGGVGLSPTHWKAWRAAHPLDPATLRLYYTPAARGRTGPQTNQLIPGAVVAEEMWASAIALGPVLISATPVSESDPATAEIGGPRHLATLGLAALRRLDFIYDGVNNYVYLRPAATPPIPYPHNRLGAVFTPADYTHDYVIAQVEPGGPADRAGLRNGDQVTSINGHAHLNWLIHPESGMINFEWPWVSAIHIHVQRGGEEVQIGVLLENIIGPPNN